MKHEGLNSPEKGCCNNENGEATHIHAHLHDKCQDHKREVKLERVLGTKCALPVTSTFHADCSHECDMNSPMKNLSILPDHVHGEGCGHEMVPHGDHMDYIVRKPDGGLELHHVHVLADGSQHCDIHGKANPVEESPLLKPYPLNGAGDLVRAALHLPWRFDPC